MIKADSIIQQGLNPILLVAEQGAPEWLTIWRILRNSESSPHNSHFRLRNEEDESSLIAYFENIPAHRIAYADSNCYVVPREHFEVIRFETQPAGPCVSVTFTPEPNNKTIFSFAGNLVQEQFDINDYGWGKYLLHLYQFTCMVNYNNYEWLFCSCKNWINYNYKEYTFLEPKKHSESKI